LEKFFVFFIIGVAISAVYAISATGLVVTYITSGVFNFAHGAVGMFLAFVYWELRVNRSLPTPIALLITLGVVAPALVITWDQLTTVLAAIGVAFGLRFLFKRTRIGIAMRAVVDNPELCAIKGLS